MTEEKNAPRPQRPKDPHQPRDPHRAPMRGRPQHAGRQAVRGGMSVRAPGAHVTPGIHADHPATQKHPVAPTDTPPVKVYALGGLEEIGRNCTVFECGDDIVIVDMGLMFPEEGMPGIDFIIPNIAPLKGKEKNIRGIIVTHGHMDHIGGLPLLIGKLG
ncbi:MAG: MBL fold metallo-hydrolase, partial [Patescibacteria group bacterium]